MSTIFTTPTKLCLLLAVALPTTFAVAHAQSNVAKPSEPAAKQTKLQGNIKRADGKRLAKGKKGPEGRTRVGTLRCEVDGGVGLIVGSSKTVNCTFKGPNGTERYAGRINKLGLDIGVTGKQYLRWVVFAPGASDATLAGRYAGVSASGALGAGFGANALIGGSKKQVVLQPISVQAGTGINVAVGVASLNLSRA